MDAGAELLRVMTLAWSSDFWSVLVSAFLDKALEFLVNLASPSPRFRKALLGGA